MDAHSFNCEWLHCLYTPEALYGYGDTHCRLPYILFIGNDSQLFAVVIEHRKSACQYTT